MKRRAVKRCTCGEPSLKGLSGTHPPCAYAWAHANWGAQWANELYPEHPHRKKLHPTPNNGDDNADPQT